MRSLLLLLMDVFDESNRDSLVARCIAMRMVARRFTQFEAMSAAALVVDLFAYSNRGVTGNVLAHRASPIVTLRAAYIMYHLNFAYCTLLEEVKKYLPVITAQQYFELKEEVLRTEAFAQMFRNNFEIWDYVHNLIAVDMFGDEDLHAHVVGQATGVSKRATLSRQMYDYLDIELAQEALELEESDSDDDYQEADDLPPAYPFEYHNKGFVDIQRDDDCMTASDHEQSQQSEQEKDASQEEGFEHDDEEVHDEANEEEAANLVDYDYDPYDDVFDEEEEEAEQEQRAINQQHQENDDEDENENEEENDAENDNGDDAENNDAH